MDSRFRKGLLGGVLCSLAGTSPAAELNFQECLLTTSPLPAIEAECATMQVAENPSGEGRKIALKVARIPTASREAAQDPIIFFAGGPGQAALEAYPMIAPALRDASARRDIVLMDQRGTGQSNPMDCPMDDSRFLGAVEDIDWREYVESCRERLDADTRYYATRHAVEDVEALRAALGVEQLNLVGGSYGSRMAMSYAQAYPDRVRSMVLFGVVPQDEPLGQSHAANLERALQRTYERCSADDGCRARFGDVGAHLDALRQRLREEPQDVQLVHPTTGELTSLTFTADAIAGVVRLLSYTSEGVSLLPLLIHEATVENRLEPMAAQALMVLASLGDQISHGMELSVICSEDLPFYTSSGEGDRLTVLGDTIISVLKEQCRYWPTEPAPPDFKQPLDVATPTLLISGEFDPVTPPLFADKAAETLPNARHLVAPGQGHNSLTAGCAPELVTAFIETANVEELDAKCLDILGPAPFFVNFSGPEP